MKSSNHLEENGLYLDEFMDVLDQLDKYKNLYTKYEDRKSGGVCIQKLRYAVKDLGYIIDDEIHEKMANRYRNFGANYISSSDFILSLSRLVAAFRVISSNPR